jgi:hypothetical protein
MSNSKPTEPPPIKMTLPRTGDIKGCIEFLSFLMAECTIAFVKPYALQALCTTGGFTPKA